MTPIAGRLLAPRPTWHRRADVVVVGSGVAGLTVALAAARVASVVVVTKGRIDAGATAWAQGGIAAAVDRADDPDAHVDDTLEAGAGLCDPVAVRVLAEEGPQRLAQLVGLGAAFDAEASGALALTREGGHRHDRIVHAGGDATGWEVQRALVAALHAAGVEVVEDAFVLDILRAVRGDDGRRAAAGVVVAVPGADVVERVGTIEARAVVLASGGLGQVYASSTNPLVATGDGIAAALRGGASVADLEFVQFHPTVLWQGGGAEGQQLLISEAVRGEGAVLLDATGRRVMIGVHPLADLAPRDVVARAMSVRMAEAPGGVDDHLFLDATGLGPRIVDRFPTIVARCRAAGIDPATEPIPVAPGAHFACGGVRTDRWGRTEVPNLFAVGETAHTGVHGANRLASNSLLEGLVFGDRVGARLVLDLPPFTEPDAIDSDRSAGGLAGAARNEIVHTMSRHAGIRRDGDGLEAARVALADAARKVPDGPPVRADWEATNIHTIATAIVTAAAARNESRGCHWRVDHPHLDHRWRHRLALHLDPASALAVSTVPLTSVPGAWA